MHRPQLLLLLLAALLTKLLHTDHDAKDLLSAEHSMHTPARVRTGYDVALHDMGQLAAVQKNRVWVCRLISQS